MQDSLYEDGFIDGIGFGWLGYSLVEFDEGIHCFIEESGNKAGT